MTLMDTEPATAKGRATRERIVAAAADLFFRQGVAGTSMPDVRAAAGVSSSQIYHYFNDKEALSRAVVAHQADSIIAAQAEYLDGLDSLDGLRAWRDFVVRAKQPLSGGGCPLGGLASELADHDVEARRVIADGFDRWAASLENALTRLVDNGVLAAGCDPQRLARALLAALQGGLLLAQAQHNTDVLEAGLDAIIDYISCQAR